MRRFKLNEVQIMKIMETITKSKMIIAAFIVLIFVTGVSIGYQISVNYQECDSSWLNDDVGLVKNSNK